MASLLAIVVPSLIGGVLFGVFYLGFLLIDKVFGIG